MAGQHLGAIRLGEGDMPDRHRRQSVLPVHRLQPLGFRDLFRRGTASLDMDAADDLVAREVADIIRRQVVAADLAIIAEEEILVVLVLLGGIAPGLQVPEMMMGIDDRNREITRRQGAEEVHFFRPPFSLPR
jgi:hypothetical protein